MTHQDSTRSRAPSPADKLLFYGCFVALIATAFGFVVRTMLINEWAIEFNLTETQKGEILGVGLWPFALSIVLFSLVIDKIGYGRAMVFAFLCHVASAIITMLAHDARALYWGTFIVALGNGTVEAVINPVVTTMFREEKTKWLNILHAGWPGGMVLGGLLALSLGDTDWRLKVGLLLIPAAIYGLILLRCRFPVQERVAAGVSYREMLREAGGLGLLIVALLVFFQLDAAFSIGSLTSIGLAVLVAAGFGVWVKSFGRPMFVCLLLIMVPLATTELGIDSWVTPLMEGQVSPPVLVLIYTQLIMGVLRLFAGPIVDRLSPLGLLATCSALAAIGLLALSGASGSMIFVAATIYAIGKTFFWPTMLGVVSERFPKGGALTINATGAVGMLGVGVIGAVFMGHIQDTAMTSRLENQPALYARIVVEKDSVFGRYKGIEPRKLEAQTKDDQQAIEAIEKQAKHGALATMAILPLIMLLCYAGLILYFRRRGGYRAEVLAGQGKDVVPAGAASGFPNSGSN